MGRGRLTACERFASPGTILTTPCHLSVSAPRPVVAVLTGYAGRKEDTARDNTVLAITLLAMTRMYTHDQRAGGNGWLCERLYR